ncbi:ExbD/TolR family protein [Flavivirga eckloniae]|uniref:Biopolymer transporter ExbD n=1 Tax=Flavivirga eckloniae TaxID=1803846 RepID=A0A2K9PK67_9FLAO|nr:biopolymer transporter ExbD [Flavivirga eckloniae]AUP77432.1 biopolymer transporter ExbD [Flavivirga eckloniae]
MRRSKFMPEVNAGSMADIAFLLLIFFLVTATISSDEGINRLLPKDCPTNDCTSPIYERNILRILINNDDKIMVNNNVVAITELKEIAKTFLDNNGDGSCHYCNGVKSANASDNPKKAVVSLQNGRHTSYKQFIAVQNELTKSYYELRNTYSLNVLKKPADKLTKEELKQVKDAYPFIISEAETK